MKSIHQPKIRSIIEPTLNVELIKKLFIVMLSILMTSEFFKVLISANNNTPKPRTYISILLAQILRRWGLRVLKNCNFFGNKL